MSTAPHQMITANRLLDGAVVYWRAGGWAETFAEGEVFSDGDAAKAALDAAKAFVAANVVVNPYLFEVKTDDGKWWPVKEREIVRAMGPSVRRDLGKQAAGEAPPVPVHPAEAVLHAQVKKADNVSI